MDRRARRRKSRREREREREMVPDQICSDGEEEEEEERKRLGDRSVEEQIFEARHQRGLDGCRWAAATKKS